MNSLRQSLLVFSLNSLQEYFSRFPEGYLKLFFWMLADFVQFSEKVMSRCLNNVEVLALGRLIHDSVLLWVFLSKYACTALAVCLWSMLCWKIKSWPIRQIRLTHFCTSLLTSSIQTDNGYNLKKFKSEFITQ